MVSTPCGVRSARCGGPLGAAFARRPGRRSTRRGESTAASTCAAATSSAGPSYRCVFSRCVVRYRSGIGLHAWCLHVLSIQYMRLYRRFSILNDTHRYMTSLSPLPRGCCACVSIQEAPSCTNLHRVPATEKFLVCATVQRRGGGGGYIRHTRRRRCERQGQTDRRPHV